MKKVTSRLSYTSTIETKGLGTSLNPTLNYRCTVEFSGIIQVDQYECICLKVLKELSRKLNNAEPHVAACRGLECIWYPLHEMEMISFR